jgi:hypothetical protein
MKKKILISHRGNTNGKNLILENSPNYVIESIKIGYDVEIDVWRKNNIIYLGHDNPQYEVSEDWLYGLTNKLWIHCKNFELMSWIINTDLHYFWHENDKLTLTSKNYLWVYPGNQPILNSIAVLPETYNDDLSKCLGICSDYIKNYND